MKNKGFTLIEMLAVITIISLITLVFLPLISNQYADKKDEISEVTQKIILDAAELYASETGKVYQTITLNDLVKDEKLEYPVIDHKTGKEIPLTKEVSISVSGDACIVGIDNCDIITYKEYENGTAVYFNPETGEKCEESGSVITTGKKDGCMKWYTFNDSQGASSVNLILDHNTTAMVAWNSSGSNETGMKEVLESLTNDTTGWKVPARLITANEIAKITNHTTFDSNKTGQTWYCLATNKQDSTSTPYCNKYTNVSMNWLFDYTYCKDGSNDWGCIHNDKSTYGYWTSTPYIDDSIRAWRVNRGGYLDIDPVSFTNHGVRPVITVEKYKLS